MRQKVAVPGWYLLGAALVGEMGIKQEGDRVIPILEPGTIEAYQKCIEVDPNGTYAAQCKQGVEHSKVAAAYDPYFG